MQTVKDVDEYIDKAPKDVQYRLIAIRKMIKSTVPEAQERISYGMPFYDFHGRLVYFAYAKKHIGIYAIFEPVRKMFPEELKGYEMSKGTIQFPLNQPLPIELLKKLVASQAHWNEENNKK